ncbi:cyclic nucleotide-binding domain-containing protein [Streptomyces sp. PTM05]|uniref:Cyclic nucleotide-binding domain-containing protein n=1 Tax=Streptantibioticus parmotrematis TaxID=2873249 RepID=A0ABS7QP21_9ACTN|nr:family 2B encapsulin nanocompartment shell protein [Streptantibioticus parmotrematis]MBY8884449.1 cyclic nucleotide-binding domain-containing protein [Streptantibioticus parmotrematis]
MSVDAGLGVESNGDSGDSRAQNGQAQLSLSTAAARNLATTTKSAPQMQGITSRWLLRILPWVQVAGGTYRVNRRLTYTVGDGRVDFVQTGSEVRVIPEELGELALLRDFGDVEVLRALAGRFTQREFEPGQVIVEAGAPANHVFLIVHGKIDKLGEGKYGEPAVLGVLADGDHFGDRSLGDEDGAWEFTAKAKTAVTVMSLSREEFAAVAAQSESLRERVAEYLAGSGPARNKHGEAEIALSSGHEGEALLPGTFVDYELSPREYELSVAQTVLRVHSRVADLYNQPMNQVEHQLRLTVEALRERQEHDLINHREFGLLHNAEYSQRLHARSGPPTPDDLDELISRRRNTQYLLAHPRTIAAFGRECNKRGLYPGNVEFHGNAVPSWRGVPLLPCNKIPVNGGNTSSIIALRVGEDNQGVIGLHQAGIPDEFEPSLSVRFMGINEKAIISYLVTAYYSAAILVPDAIGVLENVEVSLSHD